MLMATDHIRNPVAVEVSVGNSSRILARHTQSRQNGLMSSEYGTFELLYELPMSAVSGGVGLGQALDVGVESLDPHRFCQRHLRLLRLWRK